MPAQPRQPEDRGHQGRPAADARRPVRRPGPAEGLPVPQGHPDRAQERERPAQDAGLPEPVDRHLARGVAAVEDQPEQDREVDHQSAQGRPAVEGVDPVTIDAETTAAPAPTRAEKARTRKQLSEGARAERRLGWMLCAPAVVVMIAVTAYPIGYAIYLSLKRYDLRFPEAGQVRRPVQLLGRAQLAVLVARPCGHPDHHRDLGDHRAGAGHAAGPADAPHAVRPRHRCAPRSWCRTASSPSWPRSAGSTPGRRAPATWPRLFGRQRPADPHRPGDRHHHPGRGVEDDAVHGPAADGRPGPRPRGPAEGGQGRRGHGLAAVRPGSRCR